METFKQRNKLQYIHFIYHRYILLICSVSISCCLASSRAHFIHIDHNEFRAHGYPRPPLPPPLPAVDQLHHQHLPIAKELTPAEFMVDLTNDLTYRILHYHSILNRNNFAFSPTALMSVLVALYEGSAGRSATEMRNVLQLPNNRDIIRVGYRDIHRRLRTYFFGSENPLKGLSLNKDNVTITRDYETILMFYGYDLGMDMVSSTMPPKTTTTTEPTVPDALTSVNASSTTIAPMTTTPPTDTNVTMTTIDESEEKSTTTEAATTITPLTTSTTTTSTTEAPQTTVETTTEQPATTEGTSSEMETTTEAVETTTTEASSTEAVAVADDEGENGEAKTNGEVAELVSSFVAVEDAEPLLRIQKARVSRLPSSKLQVPLAKSSYPKVNYLPSSRYTTATATNSRSRSRSRNKRHLLGGYKELDANLFVTLFHPQTSAAPHNHHNHGLFSLADPASGSLIATALHNNEFETTVDIEPSFLNAGGALKQNYNTDIISHVFYLSSQQLIHTTFKVYNAVLYYKYLENLKMHALELELNTPEYNLIILLPDFNTDLVTAAASLRLGPTLRLLRKELKPRWVQAIIPDFKLHGTMFLTNDLQNMGICDIFEPNRADFRPMTDENGIYVKHIEQSINVNIRTRPINQLKRNTDQQTQPIQISVNHPFLFFIIDRDLDVAVMAGRILNPLNVRIQ